MSKDQVKTVVFVYNRLMENEKRGWDAIDDYMDWLEYLDDDQLHREVDVMYEIHGRQQVKCSKDHGKEECLIPMLLEAVGAIIDLYKETGDLHEKNKYILQYYLALTQSDMIIIG